MVKVCFTDVDDYKGLGKAIKIANENFEIIAPLDIGPRIMHFAKLDGDNIFEDEANLGETLPDGTEWKIYGGHRVWHSPEAFPRSYVSDSVPLEMYEKLEDGIILYQKEEEWTQIQKIIEVHMRDDRVKVINRLKNNGAWPIEMAVWSLTIGSRNGREICPVVQRNSGLLPNTHYVNWPYSRMDDNRVYWGQKYIVVDSDPNDESAFKFGYPNEYGWIAYFNKELCFIKKYRHELSGKYPDRGCSWETYTSNWGVELEALSTMQMVKPGKEISHDEEWFLFDGVPCPERDEEQIERVLSGIAGVAGIELPAVSSSGWDPTFETD